MEELHGAVPNMRELADEAAVRLERAGVTEDLRGWMNGRALPARGAQRRWTRAVRTVLRQRLLDNAPPDQVLGIRSGSGTGASAYLTPPRAAADRVANPHFCAAVRARMGFPLCPPANPLRPVGSAPQCQHRPRKGGPCCGAPLDASGRHAAQCEVGGHVLDRHGSAVRRMSCACELPKSVVGLPLRALGGGESSSE